MTDSSKCCCALALNTEPCASTARRASRTVRGMFALAGLAGLLSLGWAAPALAQQYDPGLYSGMKWRLLGPFRGGRITAVAGIPGQPAVYYIGTPGGGVWKTTSGGRIWTPIFDDAHVASIGAVALAASNPDIVYVGTGEQTKGEGVFKSTDGGATWSSVGLRDTNIISSVLVDPKNPDVVLVGAFGKFTPGQDRGVFRSSDGGKTWKNVLFRDDKTGVVDMVMDPGDHKVVYAAVARPRFGPFGPPAAAAAGKEGRDSVIYKSSDGGLTWKMLEMTGFPAGDLGRIGVAVAAGDHGKRVFAITDPGLFRSDDGGANWRRISTDPRVVGNFYFSKIYADPRNPDMVYVMQTCVYRSTDGGEHFQAFKGAPGGDDYHVLWIDSADPQRMILGVDQGATISVDGGKTWSTWYNQPTGQLYHVSTDNTFPYHAYAQQQDSGTVAVPSRSNYGRISFRDWFSVGGFEFGYVAADPEDSNIVYATNAYSTLTKFDKRTGQIKYVFVPGPKERASNGPPLQFSPVDPHALYLGTAGLLKTVDGGESWQSISPDLTEKPATADADAKKKQPGRGRGRPAVLSAIAASYKDPAEIWTGATNGLVQLTRDSGGTWQVVTPADLPAESGVEMIEASHHDAGVAYATATSFVSDKPWIFRTRDFGKTWEKIVAGLPDSAVARVVREDPVRGGLLYAGTETGVYVSFDDGDHWQTLQMNLPTSSMRDLTVHGDDLVVATFGRGLWVLDDLTPLRQLDAQVGAAEAHLFQPATALRVGWDMYYDTPLPPETPTAPNPPNGAIIDYYLKTAASGGITMTIYDAHGSVVRTYSSTAPPEDKLLKNIPDYWLAPSPVLPTGAGMHRFVWDLRYPEPPTLPYSYYGGPLEYEEYTLTKNAILGGTPRIEPEGATVVPGNYRVEITVDGRKYEQLFTVELDPREHASAAALTEQFQMARATEATMTATFDAYHDVVAMRAALAERVKSFGAGSDKQASEVFDAAEKQLAVFQEGGEDDAPGFGPINRDAARLFDMIETGDERPAERARTGLQNTCMSMAMLLTPWHKFNAEALPALNAQLEKNKLASIPAPHTATIEAPCVMEH